MLIELRFIVRRRFLLWVSFRLGVCFFCKKEVYFGFEGMNFGELVVFGGDRGLVVVFLCLGLCVDDCLWGWVVGMWIYL